MTETQGDLLGSAIVLVSTAVMLFAVHRASSLEDTPDVRWVVVLSIVLSITGVAIVIAT
ncbi:hypothetical protein U1707_06435 [Sphingomonas sp. PB2P12]|uniref:hypothetical protein n=1 Tax=Sphingomonas sandaracina TaxID=3096157 RepID=UPI002FCCA2D9